MSAVLKFEIALESTTCATCGVEFAAPAHLILSKRANRGEIYCPNGHCGSWKKTAEDELREQLAAQQAALDRMRVRVVDAETARDAHFAERTKAEKKLKRAKNGVCPCCKRSFTALRRHMTTKHPEWTP